ncbi:MAG: alpha-amylase [Lachnospiraceae bacterium]|nr:alpha-amylase [Lachnospiraceae bacterium]
MTKNLFTIKPGNALPLGVSKVADGVQFAVYLPGRKKCYLKLYRKGKKSPEYCIELKEEYRMGSVYFVYLELTELNSNISLARLLTEEYEYIYEADGIDIIDPYAAGISGRERWNRRGKLPLRGKICLTDFDWGGDCILRKPFHELVLYQLHPRGFTKHSSSGVKEPGTFAGLQEKIPYMKELGVNGVLLLPVYEFEEMQGEKINYWGYGTGDTYYFSPKAAYSSNEQVDTEFKQTVKKLHQNGIEVLLDFYFVPGTNLNQMTDCLRHWVLNYHVDGFRVNTEVMPSIALASDPILSGVKLLSSYWDSRMLSDAGIHHTGNTFAEYNEGFMNDARRFLKSDEGQVEMFYKRFYRHPENAAVINFMTHVNGFTMMDLVSYDIKHNESNGERNADGTEYNYSWNCGVEGKSRKKAVHDQRMRQIRNAFLMLLCSQGTPMILAGDEFGNTQDGNNNPYCHDDTVTWLNWKETKTGQQIREYVKKLIAFRKEHPVLRRETQPHLMDTLSCGIPDLSAHGLQTWRPDFSNYSRMLGILLSGKYARRKDGTEDDSLYIIINMFWENKSFDLPTLPDGREWFAAIETFDEMIYDLPERRTKPVRRKKNKRQDIQRTTVVPPRSIVVFVSR